MCFAGDGELRVEESTYCPEFGVARRSAALVYAARGERVRNGFCVARGAGELRYDPARGASVNGLEIGW